MGGRRAERASGDRRSFEAAAPQPSDNPDDICLGATLKHFFDGVTAGPLPDRLMQLADELEAAFERGELGCSRVVGRKS